MQEMKWWQSAFIGAIGGLALAILKLIDAKFFLSGVAPVEAYAGYLTYFCYMLLGSVAAVFLTDHELPPSKTKRSAFILGLLAPSVLLAIANQSVKSGDSEKRQPNIPALSWLPLSSAVAAPPIIVRPTTNYSPIAVQRLSSSALKPTFSSALSSAVGRGELNQPYAYVLGATPDKAKALATATKLQLILGETAPSGLQPKVVQIEGGSAYYVLVGGLASKQDLAKLRLSATSTAINSIGSAQNANSLSLVDRKYFADLLVNAPVLPASALAEN